MVVFTKLASAISMALLASTTSANPLPLPSPPPTSSALDFTLYRTEQPGHQNECWDNGQALHVAPADVGKCFPANTFYTARIDAQAYGYSCTLNVYGDDKCNGAIGGYTYPPDWSKPCQFAGNSQIKHDLYSWKVTCTYTV